MTLKRNTIQGIAWNGLGNVASQMLRVVSLLIMVRLLTPEDFGVYAILLVFVGLFNAFANTGVAQAVIYLDVTSQRMLSSIFYLNLAVGVLLYSAMFLLAVPAAYFFDNDQLSTLMRVVGFVFVFGALSAIQQALREKPVI